MKKGIFISYRREDSKGEAGRIYEKLLKHFKKENIFFDVDNIAPGKNFSEEVFKAVNQCDIMLVIIGKKWIDEIEKKATTNDSGEEDWVELEICTGIAKGLKIIPVLLEDTKMPETQRLPEKLQPLTVINAVSIRHVNFATDFGVLIKELNKKREKKVVDNKARQSRFINYFVIIFLLFIVAFAVWQNQKREAKERNVNIISNIHSDGNAYGEYYNFFFIPSIRILRDTLSSSNRIIWIYNFYEKAFF